MTRKEAPKLTPETRQLLRTLITHLRCDDEDRTELAIESIRRWNAGRKLKSNEKTLAMYLDASGLDEKIVCALQAANVWTVGDLNKATDEELFKIPTIGPLSVERCRVVLKQLGVRG